MKNNYHEISPGCVTNMITDLQWLPLKEQSRAHRLSYLRKIKKHAKLTLTQAISSSQVTCKQEVRREQAGLSLALSKTQKQILPRRGYKYALYAYVPIMTLIKVSLFSFNFPPQILKTW